MTSPIDPAVHAALAQRVDEVTRAASWLKGALTEAHQRHEAEADQLRAKLSEAEREQSELAEAMVVAEKHRDALQAEVERLRAELAAEREQLSLSRRSGADALDVVRQLEAELMEARESNARWAQGWAMGELPPRERQQQPSDAPLSRGELVRALRAAACECPNGYEALSRFATKLEAGR